MSMITHSRLDPISDYDQALQGLATDPDNLDLKHRAVLALLRAGSLDFALKEYQSYGLADIRNHEDVMALGGRLSKDLYLRNKGKAALSHAQDAAHKYEAAFKDSQGYYSGINAATMALMADMPPDIIKDRVTNILDILPPTKNLLPEEHYFVEATRAECYLLLGERESVKDTLRNAITFDPLNYFAHASTLKQFRLILNKRGQDQSWLSAFRPPKALHYAGHIWKDTETAYDKLPMMISDLIQQQDIGFGYGALAAGADIVIAESLLAEGVELNVFLPSSVERFLDRSVRPFGQGWVPRFESCLARAESYTCLSDTGEEVSSINDILCAQMAMGKAILRSDYLDTQAVQLLIGDLEREGSLTAHHGREWKDAGLNQINLPLNDVSKTDAKKYRNPAEIKIIAKDSKAASLKTYVSLNDVISDYLNVPADDSVSLALHFDLPNAESELDAIISGNLKEAILVSEVLASYAALKHKNNYRVIFAGTHIDKSGLSTRIYTLQPLS